MRSFWVVVQMVVALMLLFFLALLVGGIGSGRTAKSPRFTEAKEEV